MESPFVFGKTVKGKSFVDRKNELKHLVDNFNSGINSLVISPVGWGKTSLVQKATAHVSGKKHKICHLDLFRIHDKYEFLDAYAHGVIKASSNKWEDWVSAAKEFLKGIVSSVSIGPDPSADFRMTISREMLTHNEKAILDLPEKLAKLKKIRFVIWIDEFQKIAGFRGSLLFQQLLRSHWQDQKHACYCFSGSRRNLLSKLSTSPSHPFYRFGDALFLQKIKPKHWYGHIQKQFAATGKSIDRDSVTRILEITANHPFHVQQLSHTLWRLTDNNLDPSVFETGLEELMLSNQVLFKRELGNLTPLQLKYLSAIVNREPHLNSMNTIHKYELGSPGNLSTLKAAMEAKGILDYYDPEPMFIDPLFEYWLKNIIQL